MTESPTRSIHATLEKLLAAAVPVEETVSRSLLDANNCVLAQDIRSTIDVPLATNSAMDGYAAKALISDGKTLSVSQRVVAGECPEPLAKGSVARIFTGAPLPDGADSVVAQEEVLEHKGLVTLPKKISPGQNVRDVGEDIKVGEQLFSSGHRLRAQDLGLIASVGIDSVKVKRPLKVAICCTGNELVEPGSRSIKYGEIFNSNLVTLMAILRNWGMDAIDCGIISDDPDLISRSFVEASSIADCVVTTGGVSVGDEDHVKTVLSELGEINFWKLNIKPGKPMVFGRIGETPILGLPGNAVSSFVTFLLLAKPFLFTQQGSSYREPRYIPVVAGFDISKTSDREQYLRVRIYQRNSELTAVLYSNQGSGVFSSVCKSDALAVVPPKTTVARNTVINVLMIDSLVN